MVLLGWQLDYLWNPLKLKLLGTPVREILYQISWSRKIQTKFGPHLFVTADIKGHGRGKLPFACLLLPLLSCLDILLLQFLLNTTSSRSQSRLKNSRYPGVLSDSSSGLGPLRYWASWPEQLLKSQSSQYEADIVGLSGPQPVSQSNKSHIYRESPN